MVTGAELEAAAADSAGSLTKGKKQPFDQQGQPCKNCGVPLEGWYCHACGQNADTHHRSILHLIWEAIEGMFHLDGRLAKTLPLLFFKPGVLAKDYMEGRIARHVPPFRTFLVALLLFIFAAEHAIHSIRHDQELKQEKEAEALTTPQGRKAKADEMRKSAAEARDERLRNAAQQRDERLAETGADKAAVAQEYAEDVKKAQDRYAAKIAAADALQNNPNAGEEALARLHNRGATASDQIRGLDFSNPEKLKSDANKIAAEAEGEGAHVNVVAPEAGEKTAHASGEHGAKDAAKNWFKDGLAKAVANPDYYTLLVFGWAHRLAVLLLPITGLMLALVYRNRKQYFIYDHLLVATNLLSFSFLANALGLVLPEAAWKTYFGLLSLWVPFNLFQTLRGGYGSTMVGAILKTLIVWLFSMTAFGVLVLGLMLFTLSQI